MEQGAAPKHFPRTLGAAFVTAMSSSAPSSPTPSSQAPPAVVPAAFTYKGPAEALRHVLMSYGPLCIYSTQRRLVTIPRVSYSPCSQLCGVVPSLPDSVILQHMSTSPHCEPADFGAQVCGTVGVLAFLYVYVCVKLCIILFTRVFTCLHS